MSRRRLAVRDRHHPLQTSTCPMSRPDPRSTSATVSTSTCRCRTSRRTSERSHICPDHQPTDHLSDGDPSCAYGTDAEQVSLTPIDVPVTAEGTLGASFPTQVDPSGEDNAPIAASRPISTSPGDPTTPSFFCDNSPDYAGSRSRIPLRGPRNHPESTSNTAFIPLSFAAQPGRLPANPIPLVSSDSAFSLEHFLPAAVDSTCASDSGVADVNTATRDRAGGAGLRSPAARSSRSPTILRTRRSSRAREGSMYRLHPCRRLRDGPRLLGRATTTEPTASLPGQLVQPDAEHGCRAHNQRLFAGI